MNIWFAADIPEDLYGGVSRSMYELASGLKYHGHRVDIYTRDKIGSKNYLTFSMKLGIRFLLSGRNRPDWIIARSSDGIICALIIRLLGLKTKAILHNHGWEEKVYALEKKLPRTIVAAPTTWKSTVIRFPLLRLMLRMCRYCMSGTIQEIRYLGDKYPNVRNKLVYLPNGTDVQPEEYWNNRDEYPYTFLSVGNITWKKNIRHTVRVFSHIKEKLPDAQLYCIGTGTDDTVLQNYITSGMADITNISSVPFKEMVTWYKKCPFMIASSRYEGGHSLAILEAMSFGITVFASEIPSNRELIHDRVNGYLITGSDVKADADSIFNTLTQGTNQTVRERAVATAKLNRWNRQATRLERILCRDR